MQTLRINIEDSAYTKLLQKGIDIESHVRVFLSDLLADEYPAISTDKAKKRVAEAIRRYQNNDGGYLDEKAYAHHLSQTISKLKYKYADTER